MEMLGYVLCGDDGLCARGICARGLRARKYYKKHVETTETMSEASERIKAYSCIAPSTLARDGDMQSV